MGDTKSKKDRAKDQRQKDVKEAKSAQQKHDKLHPPDAVTLKKPAGKK